MSAAAAPAARIAAALGPSLASSSPDALAAAAVNGMAPRAVTFPRSEEQVAAVLGLAQAEGWAVVPWGSGHSRPGGSLPARYDVALGLTGLATVLDHDSDNLTVTAQAGAALAEVNRLVRPRHQGLPLGFPHERRTLGGLVAANRTPPQRLATGDLRDQVLGLRVATADGKLVRYGRKVLKNVAGYDMNKLFVGSEGLLGVIVEVTFKLAALPDETGWVLGLFPDPRDAFACAAALYRGPLQPSGLFILDPHAAARLRQAQGLGADGAAAHLLVGFAGRGVAVKRQIADTRALLKRHVARGEDVFPELAEGAAAVLGAPAELAPDGGVLLRLGMAPTGLPDAWERLADDLIPDAGRVADYGSGRLLVALPVPANADEMGRRIAALRAKLAERRGFAVVERAPAAVRRRVPAWGDLGGETTLLGALKAQLDPKNILSPGRFL